MYKIIGGDGKQYGPVTADQLREWIATGRVNASTLTQLEGDADWKPLSTFSEFASLPLPLPPATAGPTVNAEALAAEIIARDYVVDVGACLSRGWNLLQRHFWLTVGATFVIFMIDLVAGSIPFVGAIASLLLSFVLWGGLGWMFLKLVRGEPADLADAFIGFRQSFVPLMLGGLVASLLVVLGCFLCIAPGVYLLISWMLFAPLLIIDKRLEFWPALECSRKVTAKHWWQLFGLSLLTALIAFAGLFVCGIGIFVTLPLTTAAMVYAYEDIFGAEASGRAMAANPETS